MMESSPTAEFWNSTPLSELSDEQWESLCDGCGKCCLHKLQDEDTDEVFYTRVACRLLDTRSGGCSDYQNRFSRVPDCMNIRALTADQFAWLPDTCAYRLRHDNQPLPYWHPLISGNQHSVHKDSKAIRGRVISEDEVAEVDLEDHVITWINA
jgi:uncharacterized cysteine cluster protein YcgN (CxxCxxCC family)